MNLSFSCKNKTLQNYSLELCSCNSGDAGAQGPAELPSFQTFLCCPTLRFQVQFPSLPNIFLSLNIVILSFAVKINVR